MHRLKLYYSATSIAAIIGVLATPLVSFAFSCPVNAVVPPTNFTDVVCFVDSLINSILPLIVGASLLVFFAGLIKLIRGSGDPKNIAAGKQLMIWGIVALFVMFSFIGILNLFVGDFFGKTVGVPQFPETSTP